MPPVAKDPISPAEVALIVLIFAGWFIVCSIQAVLAGFPLPRLTDREALAIVIIECIAFPVALAVLWARGWRWKDLGIRADVLHTFAGLLLFGATVVVYLVQWELLKQVEGGRDFLVQMAKATSVSLPVAMLLSVVNGVFEEFFLCRYLLEAFAKHGPALALGVSALVRVSYHLYQGPLGALFVLGFGIVVTAFYWRIRQVWPAMVAHIMADLFALV